MEITWGIQTWCNFHIWPIGKFGSTTLDTCSTIRAFYLVQSECAMPSERVQRQIDRLLDEAEQAMGVLNWEVVFQRSQAVLVLDALNEDAKSYLDASERAAGATPKTAPQVAIPAPPAPVAPLPTSFVSGRYQVKRFLGEGGKKKVYLANDLTFATFYSRRVLRGF